MTYDVDDAAVWCADEETRRRVRLGAPQPEVEARRRHAQRRLQAHRPGHVDHQAAVRERSGPAGADRAVDNEAGPAPALNVELAYVPFYGSWLNRIEAQFTALRYFALDGTDHNSHAEQASMICRYIAWRNRHAATHPRLREIVSKAETIKRAKVA